MAAKDSLFSQEKIRKVQNLNFLEQIRQQEIAEAIRQAQEKREGNIQMLGVGTFIAYLLDPLIVSLSHDIPVLNLFFLVILASLLVPLDSWMEGWVNEKLAPDSN